MKTVRALLVCDEVVHSRYNKRRHIKMMAEYDKTIPEEKRFCEASPWANFDIYINNEQVFDFFEPGGKYYLDMRRVTDQELKGDPEYVRDENGNYDLKEPCQVIKLEDGSEFSVPDRLADHIKKLTIRALVEDLGKETL